MEKVRSFQMYTTAGDRACDAMVKKIEKKILGKIRITKEEIISLIEKGIKKIEVKHGEVHDTEPPQDIAHYISQALKEAGYGYVITRWDF